MFINPTLTTPKYNPLTSLPNQQKHQLPSPHQYHTLICDYNRAKLQQKHHDHLVHDAYSKKKQKRERRILISLDGNTDSHIPTKYSPAVIPTSPSNQYSRNHKENLLYDAYCKKKKNRHEINSNPPVLKKPSSWNKYTHNPNANPLPVHNEKRRKTNIRDTTQLPNNPHNFVVPR